MTCTKNKKEEGVLSPLIKSIMEAWHQASLTIQNEVSYEACHTAEQVDSTWNVRSIQREMSSNLHHSSLHCKIPSNRNSFQNYLNIRYLFRRNVNGELAPIKNITKWQWIVIGDGHRNTSQLNCCYHSRTRYFMPAWAQAKLALTH